MIGTNASATIIALFGRPSRTKTEVIDWFIPVPSIDTDRRRTYRALTTVSLQR